MIDKEETIKAATFLMPSLASITGVLLMLKHFPARDSKDLAHRATAACITSLLLGFVVLTAIAKTSIKVDVQSMALEMFGDADFGLLILHFCVFTLSGLVGWVVFSGFAAWVSKNGESVIERALNKATNNEKKSD